MERFFEYRIGPDWRSSPPRHVSPAEALEALFELNAIFQPNFHLIRSLPFSSRYERDADRSLEKLAHGEAWNERDPKPIIWRVLIERHVQSMVVVQANELQGAEGVAVIPSALPEALVPVAVALFLQYEMKLVLPIGKHLPKSLQSDKSLISFVRH